MTEKYLRIFGLVAVRVVALAMLAITHHTARARLPAPTTLPVLPSAVCKTSATPSRRWVSQRRPHAWACPMALHCACAVACPSGSASLSGSAMGPATPDGCTSATLAWPKSLHLQNALTPSTAPLFLEGAAWR